MHQKIEKYFIDYNNILIQMKKISDIQTRTFTDRLFS